MTVAVSDDRDRSANASRDLVVGSTVGTWVHAGYLASIGRVEARSLTIRTQDATAVSGTLTKDGVPAPFTGSIRRDRQIRLVLDGTSEVLEGVIPSALSMDAVEWPLSLQGRSARAESLVFKKVAGEPSGPGPDADLGMRFFSFSAPYAIKQISPVLFDGSASRGDGLSYFIEFGDGQVASTSTATHPLEREGTYQARLTVVDRFGRFDSEVSVIVFIRSWVLAATGTGSDTLIAVNRALAPSASTHSKGRWSPEVLARSIGVVEIGSGFTPASEGRSRRTEKSDS